MVAISPKREGASLLLTLLMAGNSLAAQHLSGLDVQGLVLMDLAAAATFVLVCGSRLLRLLTTLQSLLSLFCVSYAASMGMPPTLTAVVNGGQYLAGMGIRSWCSYLDPFAVLLFGLFFLGQWRLCAHKPCYGRARWLAAVPLLVLTASRVNALHAQPVSHFTADFILKPKNRHFETAPRRSLKYRGYSGTFILEVVTGHVRNAHYTPPSPCSPSGTESIPAPSASKHVSLIQVESLDFELLEMQIEGEYVMPFLHSLLPHSVLLRLDGAKRLSSANSDFEIFNGLKAMPHVVHYEHETAYPRSLVPCLKKGGRSLTVFHGLPADYMNLRAAYRLQGFTSYHDLHAMSADGVKPLPCWWAGVVSDADIFNYALRKMPSGPFVQFLITMNMHLPEHLDKITGQRLFTSSSRSAFLTLARDTDTALRNYVQALPPDALIILWGDHRSYDQDNSGQVPFLVYSPQQRLHYDGRNLPDLTRCKMFHYLRRLFGCPAPPAPFGSGPAAAMCGG